MTSISPKKPSEIGRDVAHDVAFELGLPWRVKALEEYPNAKPRTANAGLTGELENGGFPSDTAWIRTLHIRTPSGQVSPKRIIEYIIWSRMTT
jgi:hypothetical protein